MNTKTEGNYNFLLDDLVLLAVAFADAAKPRIATGSDNSFEHLLYLFLADALEDEPRVRFVVAKGEHLILPVYGRDVRMMHGDGIRYEGGVGGIMIPLNRGIMRLDRGRPCAVTAMGHHHAYLDAGRATVNGSVVGTPPMLRSATSSGKRPRRRS